MIITNITLNYLPSLFLLSYRKKLYTKMWEEGTEETFVDGVHGLYTGGPDTRNFLNHC